MLVNDQLNQLYIEMELEGLSTKLTLEEGITSSSSSGEEPVTLMSKVIILEAFQATNKKITFKYPQQNNY